MLARPKKTIVTTGRVTARIPRVLIFCLEFFEVLERTNELPLAIGVLALSRLLVRVPWQETRKGLGKRNRAVWGVASRPSNGTELLQGVKTRCGICVMSPFALVRENMASRSSAPSAELGKQIEPFPRTEGVNDATTIIPLDACVAGTPMHKNSSFIFRGNKGALGIPLCSFK